MNLFFFWKKLYDFDDLSKASSCPHKIIFIYYHCFVIIGGGVIICKSSSCVIIKRCWHESYEKNYDRSANTVPEKVFSSSVIFFFFYEFFDEQLVSKTVHLYVWTCFSFVRTEFSILCVGKPILDFVWLKSVPTGFFGTKLWCFHVFHARWRSGK